MTSDQAPGSENGRTTLLDWTLVAAVCVATIAVTYNSMAIVSALPKIKNDLDMTAFGLQWVMNVYMLACAVLVALMGRLSDRVGKLQILVFGIAGFMAGSALCFLAESKVLFLLARVIQAIGGAAIFGVGAAILSLVTSDKDRPFAVGLWGATIAFGTAGGPLAGGAITTAFGWRYIFVSDVVILAVSLGLALLVAMRGPALSQGLRREKLDYAGAVLLVVFLGALAFALSRAHEIGWTSATILGCFVLAALSFVLFVRREAQNKNPMINLTFFRRHPYIVASFGIFVCNVCIMGMVYYYNLFVQSPNGRGLSAFQAGLTLLPYTGAMFLAAVTMPRLVSDANQRWMVVGALTAMTIGFLSLRALNDTTGVFDASWRMLVAGLGVGTIMSVLPRIGLEALPREHSGQGSGVISTFLYFGLTMGTTLGSIVVSQVNRVVVDGAVSALPSPPADQAQLTATLATGSTSQIQSALSTLDSADATAVATILRDVQVDGFAGVMVLLAALSAVMGVLTFLLLPASRRGSNPT